MSWAGRYRTSEAPADRGWDPLSAVPATAEAGTSGRGWGWGGGDARPRLPAGARDRLQRALGVKSGSGPAVPLERVEVPASVLSERARERLGGAVGEEHVDEGHRARVVHAAGQSYEDLVRLRAGDGRCAPDAVVAPGSRDEVAAALAVCREEEVAVVPFGGGTSVVGGVEPRRGRFRAVVSLDLGRLDRMVALDERSLTATFEPGVSGVRAEALLDERGLTLGHFPESFEHATIGGYLATRSTGQASTGYGRVEDLVLGLHCATPAGELRVDPVPASAAGPSLLELLVGSEGAFGVITEATLAVRRRPSARHYEGLSFASFEAGAEGLRALAQAGASPDVARLSDDGETALALAQAAADGGLGARALRRYLRLRGQRRPCLAIVGWEDSEAEVSRRRARSARLLRAAGGLALGARPGNAWARGRFDGPYLRDDLVDAGILVETLETATTWARLARLQRSVGSALTGALTARGTPPLVGCHISHVYRTGASLYFTVLAAQERGSELAQWRAAKAAASDAIVTGGGTITHHHAVGSVHLPWLSGEVGGLGVEALRAVKARLDPTGIMNPGKLVP